MINIGADNCICVDSKLNNYVTQCLFIKGIVQHYLLRDKGCLCVRDGAGLGNAISLA